MLLSSRWWLTGNVLHARKPEEAVPLGEMHVYQRISGW